MISLMDEDAFEPPDESPLYLSLLLQQSVSMIKQYDGVSTGDLYATLVTAGRWSEDTITLPLFATPGIRGAR